MDSGGAKEVRILDVAVEQLAAVESHIEEEVDPWKYPVEEAEHPVRPAEPYVKVVHHCEVGVVGIGVEASDLAAQGYRALDEGWNCISIGIVDAEAIHCHNRERYSEDPCPGSEAGRSYSLQPR